MNNYPNNGVFAGTTLIQASGELGGARNVFVKLQGIKNELVFPTFGGQLKNPFKTGGKFYAGDLMEYRTNENGLKPEIYLLKTFKVAEASSNTTVYIIRDGYSHIPCVGDILMKAPETFDGQGAGYAITAVEETTHKSKDVWKVTFGTSLGSLVENDVLVEAKSASATATMLVQNPNAIAPSDYDVFYPASGSTTAQMNVARYFMTPALHGLMYTKKMSAMPKVVLDINKSKVNGWFEI